MTKKGSKSVVDECICGEPDCNGSCLTNNQCSFQESNRDRRFTAAREPAQSGRWICPMRCEGEKTYPAPGDCPVCGMHMEQLLAFGAG